MITTHSVKKFFGFYAKLNLLIMFAILRVRDVYKPEGRVFDSHGVTRILFELILPAAQ
jgi:hypothetical protein